MNTMIEAIERARACWNRGDLEGYLELYHEDIALHGYTVGAMNKTQVRGFYAGFFEAFPGAQLTFDEIVTQGATMMTRFHLDLEHRGAFMGIPPSGLKARVDGHTSLHFAGEQVVERWSTSDFLGLFVQLGAIKMPG